MNHVLMALVFLLGVGCTITTAMPPPPSGPPTAAAEGWQPANPATGPVGPPRPARVPGASIVGGRWFAYTEHVIDINSDGTLVEEQGELRGFWRQVDQSGRAFELNWAEGKYLDIWILTDDRCEFLERSEKGTIKGTLARRIEVDACIPRGEIVGLWDFHTDHVIQVDRGGTLVEREGGLRGFWHLRDPASRTYEMNWNLGEYLVTLVLSADGQRLEGKNQEGRRAVGNRLSH
jgi:hypothetical protein